MPNPDTSAPAVSGITRMIDDAMTGRPQPRWRTWKIVYGRTTEVWVSDAELARIEAGIAAGTIETRAVKDRAGMVHQWLEVRA
jgi:hypothetical protein